MEGRTASALLRLRRLIEGGAEHPGRLQGLIARQLRNLIRAGELIEQGASREEIGRATGVTHPYPLGRLVTQAEAIGRPAAERALRAVEAADHAVKTGPLRGRARARAAAHQPAALLAARGGAPGRGADEVGASRTAPNGATAYERRIEESTRPCTSTLSGEV